MERLASVLLDRAEFTAQTPAAPYAEREVEETMVSFAIRNVVPTDPANIPAAAITEFRRVHAEERGLFQAEIGDLIKALDYLKDVKDPQEVEQHLRDQYQKTLGPRFERLRRDLRSANIDTVESAMAVSVALPAAVAAILAAVGLTLVPLVAAPASIAFAGWTVQRKRKRAVASLLKPSPEAFLYQASKLSTSQTMVRGIYTSSRAFIRKSH